MRFAIVLQLLAPVLLGANLLAQLRITTTPPLQESYVDTTSQIPAVSRFLEQKEKQELSSTRRTKRMTQKPRKANFVFIMGLEGTGHHFIQKLFLESPYIKQLEELGIHPKTTYKIAEMLYNKNKESIFNAWQMPAKNKRGIRKRSKPVMDLANLQTKLAQLMVEVEDAIPNQQKKTTITVPVNTLFDGPNFSIGMVSYPNHNGRNRYLQHPNLDLFYQACDIAKVKCSHIYLYRDPHLITKSVLKRQFVNDVLEASQLYGTDLAVMTVQLLHHANRTEGCLGFYEPNVMQDDQLWKTVQHLLGWKDPIKFQEYIKRVFHPSKALTHEERENLVPTHWQPAVDSWISAHQRTLDLCRANVAKYYHHDGTTAVSMLDRNTTTTDA